MNIRLCNHDSWEAPMFDPIVAAHCSKESSYTQSIVREIGTYAKFFEGQKGLTFVDIGANIGLVSIYASPACKRIVAIEPSPETFPVLKAMTAGIKTIECFEGALSPTFTTVDFYLNDLNSTASSTVNTYGKKISVTGYPLSMLLTMHQLEQVDLCKIDAEGAEGMSLSYRELEIVKPIVKSYLIETHNCPVSTWEYKLGTLVNYLMTLGYSKIDVRKAGFSLWAR